ncbi:MAG: tyrosine-type recombinase/integrase [Gemmataceae bacterium]
MASLQERKGSYRIQFPWYGKLHGFTLGKVRDHEARKKCEQVDYLLMRLKQKLILLPDGVDIVEFVEHDGQPPKTVNLPEAPKQAVTLGRLKDRYLATLANGSIEASSLGTVTIHLKHAERILGEGFPLTELSLANLQGYVDKRAKAKISAYTIRKEIRTLGAAWRWGRPMKLTHHEFPADGIRYPKDAEKPPFMTRSEIDRQIAAGGDPSLFWECMYLQVDEISELLGHVKKCALHPWIYPAFCFAAHTGSRRSEIVRAQTVDVDFASGTIVIREKKRLRGKLTTRRAPMTSFLRRVLKEWLKVHPGGPHLFCHDEVVYRSKKRSETTGYKGGRNRTTSASSRVAVVHKRAKAAPAALTRDEFHDHFRRALADSKWAVIRGVHTLRHSFCSAMAAAGVDQRIIDEIVGHQSAETARRYRHLIPDVKKEALSRVFI